MPVVLSVVHWLHVVGGAVWFGGQVFGAAVLWPALLRRPPGEARALYDAIGAPAERVMGPAGLLVVAGGALRGTWLGPIRSWEALVATGYGRAFLVALVLTIALGAYGGRTRARLDGSVWKGDAWAPGAARFLARTGAVTVGGLAVVVACMVRMRLGG